MIKYLDKLSNYSSQTALCFGRESYTYLQLNSRISSHAQELSDIKQGNIVVLVSDYSFEAICLFLALASKKCIVVPVVSDNYEEIQKRIAVSEPDVVINLRGEGNIKIDSQRVRSQRHDLILTMRQKNRAGLILFSSGSTGQPKAMIHDLDNLLETYVTKRGKSLSIMVFLMFDHIGGLNTLLNSLSMGAKIVIPDKREPEHVAELIEREKVHLLPASPTFLNMMLIAGVNTRFNLSSLRMVTYGTEPMPESLLVRLKEEFPRVKLLQTFGTSETGIAQTSSRSSKSLEIRIDDPNQEYKVINGELWLRSKTQILGYLNHDMSSFSDDGWFQTGDLVQESSDGFLKIIGRAKEVINVGGEKVLPSEVESAVLEVEGVLDCVAYAIANSITGQTVAVNVTISPKLEKAYIKKSIRKHCKHVLDSYKVPTKIQFSNDVGISSRMKKIRIDKYN
ncbi:long-chain fatty acid--CoA ligase [Vibrio amylolyticus]|uniref:long-chain fatty acid--CoA ligase n=1 Tax=Vibrio amylolyticus TaxID=2847292 RepID=UPI00355352DF